MCKQIPESQGLAFLNWRLSSGWFVIEGFLNIYYTLDFIRSITLIRRWSWAQFVCNVSFRTIWNSPSLRVAFILSLFVLFSLQGRWNPDTAELECDCKPKKELTFANSFYVAPNKIDFSSVFLKFSPLNQAAVMATLVLIFLIYIIIIIWTRRQDRKDLLKVGDYVIHIGLVS